MTIQRRSFGRRLRPTSWIIAAFGRSDVWPDNAPEARVTITVASPWSSGAVSARHAHPVSDQDWLIEQGSAELLMDGGDTDGLQVRDIVRTPAGAIHGISNTGDEPFIYLAVTIHRRISARPTKRSIVRGNINGPDWQGQLEGEVFLPFPSRLSELC